MPKGKSTKNRPLDKILGIVIALTLIANFVIVWYVSASFENGEDIVLYETDSSTDFPVLTLDTTPPDFDVFGSGYYLRLPSNFQNYTKTPIYTGNNTWSMSINGSAQTLSQFGMYVIDLPNLDDWIISEITVNQTKNTDTDLLEAWNIYYLDNDGILHEDDYGMLLFENFGAGGSSIYANRTLDVPLYKALDIRDSTTGHGQYVLALQHIDKDADGLGAWAWELDITITGKQIQTFNLDYQIGIGLALATALNIIVLVVSNDRFDVGGYVNDIPDKKRR